MTPSWSLHTTFVDQRGAWAFNEDTAEALLLGRAATLRICRDCDEFHKGSGRPSSAERSASQVGAPSQRGTTFQYSRGRKDAKISLFP